MVIPGGKSNLSISIGDEDEDILLTASLICIAVGLVSGNGWEGDGKGRVNTWLLLVRFIKTVLGFGWMEFELLGTGVIFTSGEQYHFMFVGNFGAFLFVINTLSTGLTGLGWTWVSSCSICFFLRFLLLFLLGFSSVWSWGCLFLSHNLWIALIAKNK